MQGRLRQIIEEQGRSLKAGQLSGFVATFVYCMEAELNEYYLVVIFTSKEPYLANVQSPEQDARYRQLLALLQYEPEWHDGEIVYVEQGLIKSYEVSKSVGKDLEKS